MEEKRATGAWVVAVMLVLLLLPPLYVLSVGPCAMLYPDPNDMPQWIDAFYAPLFWLENNSDAAASFFAWYCNWWRGVEPYE
jgi:hypothetical protein